MKINVKKIKGVAITIIAGRVEHPDYYEADVHYEDEVGGSLYFYADGPTKQDAKNKLITELQGIVNGLKALL